MPLPLIASAFGASPQRGIRGNGVRPTIAGTYGRMGNPDDKPPLPPWLAPMLTPADATSAVPHAAIDRSIPWGTIPGGPTILNQAPPTPDTPGEYRPPTLASRGDTVYLKSDGTAPLDFVLNHEMAHRDHLLNNAQVPQAYKPTGSADPLVQLAMRDNPMGTERFAQAMSEARRSLYGSGPFGADSSTAHRADPTQVARLRQILIRQLLGGK